MDTALTLPRLVDQAARDHPDNDCIVFPTVRRTYREVYGSATEVARALTALGIGPGDAVGTLMPNCLDFVHVMVGTSMVGALFVPINARLAPRELAHVVADSEMAVLLTTDAVDEHVDYVARLGDAFPELAAGERGRTPAVAGAAELRHVVLMGARTAPGFEDRGTFLARGRAVSSEHVREVARSGPPQTPYIMMYTSGTTAEPKGCPLTHESVVRLGRALGDEAFGLTADDRMWNPLPMFHVSAQAPMVSVFAAGAAWVSMTHFDPDSALDLIERERATVLYPAYPTLTAPLLNHPRYRPDTFRRARAMLTVGPPDLLRTYQEKLPHTSHVSCYGSTETGGVAVMGRLDDPPEERFTSGKPFSGVQAQVRDPATDEVQPAGVTGTLHIRGFNLFQGYRNDPQKTAASFDGEGWFWTGDLASIDAAGQPHVPRPDQGRAQGGRGERRVPGGRGLPHHPPRHPARLRRGSSRPPLRRGPGCVRRGAPRRGAHRGGGGRVLQARVGQVQGAAPRPLHHGLADVGDEDPEVPATGPLARRVRHRGRAGGVPGVGRPLSAHALGSPCPPPSTTFVCDLDHIDGGVRLWQTTACIE